jgi:hypothetical protein
VFDAQTAGRPAAPEVRGDTRCPQPEEVGEALGRVLGRAPGRRRA